MAEESFSGLNEQSIKNAQKIKSEVGEIKGAIDRLNRSLGEEKDLLDAIKSAFSGISNSADKIGKLQDNIKNSSKGTVDALKQQKEQLNIVKNLNAQIDILYERAETKRGRFRENLREQAQNTAELRDRARQLADIFGEIVEDSTKLNSSTLFFSKISDIIKDIPALRQFSSPFEAAAKAARQTVLDNAKIASIKETISNLSEEELTTGRGLTKERLELLGLTQAANNQTYGAAVGALRNYQAINKESNVFMTGLSTGFKSIGQGISNFFKSGGWIGALITGAVELFKFVKDAMFAADKQAVSLQRNLNLSQKEAYILRDYFSDIKNDLETQYKLTTEIINAQSELSELSSLSNLYSKEALDAQVQLTKEYKLGADESSKLNKLFILNNAQGTKGLDIALEEVAAYANQNKILFNGSKILKEISTTSGQILVSFKGSTEALTQAVLKSQKLGINLSSARDISKSLLNFEESISKELEAELLVGKDLNLERARSLALEGKFADAAEEVFKTVGGINEFERLNVIQQEALAAAAGMTVDQFADALLTQKFIGTETGNQIKRLREAGLEEQALALARGEITKEQLEKSLKQLDAQEKFNIAIAEAKEIFTNLVKGGVLQDLADTLKNIVESLGRLGYGQEAKEERAEVSVEKVKTGFKEGKIKVSSKEIDQLESMETAVKNRTTGLSRFLLDFIDSGLPGGEFRKAGRVAEDIISQQASIKLAERANQLLEQIANKELSLNIDSREMSQKQNISATTS